MREKVPGFDPFYRGWAAYEQGGIEAVAAIEAPIFMLPLDQTDPELARRLVELYGSRDPEHPELGLMLSDLRWGMWPDASPVQVRGENEEIGVHLNTFTNHQVRYGKLTDVERAGLEVMTLHAEELVRDAIDVPHGVMLMQSGEQVPTAHRHIIGREVELDGLTNWKERQLVDLDARRAMRERLQPAMTTDRFYQVAVHIGETLGRFARG